MAKLAKGMVSGEKPEGMDPRMKKGYQADYDFEFEEKHKTVSVTEQGVAKAEKFLGITHLYRAENGPLVNHLQQSLKAESLYQRDVDYAVIHGEVKSNDELPGRIPAGTRGSEGLRPAVQGGEGGRPCMERYCVGVGGGARGVPRVIPLGFASRQASRTRGAAETRPRTVEMTTISPPSTAMRCIDFTAGTDRRCGSSSPP